MKVTLNSLVYIAEDEKDKVIITIKTSGEITTNRIHCSDPDFEDTAKTIASTMAYTSGLLKI